ncbi:hypothetical protein GMO_23240 [Gluconobacter morbifer G707]|uniref:Uncharacterized protein n=1 Tax=Gluconobacter morbifer G707 TaxID=1088869 RepID=G6XLS5_9PROT|nr:hypothetical protein GMO_23240 [Gluconobacter morbifer G707]
MEWGRESRAFAGHYTGIFSSGRKGLDLLRITQKTGPVPFLTP